jgi:hypothetical protein
MNTRWEEMEQRLELFEVWIYEVKKAVLHLHNFAFLKVIRRRERDYFMIPHACGGLAKPKSKPALRALSFLLSLAPASEFAALGPIKIPTVVGFDLVLRRERDSNPRTCYSQRFSRPPHSTALPSLRRKCKCAR